MKFKILSLILALSLFSQFTIYAEGYSRLEYEITWNDDYVEIAGAGNETGEEVSICLYDNKGEILYADQANTGNDNEFLFKANVGNEDVSKIVFGGDKRASTLIKMFEARNSNVYISKRGNDTLEGTSSYPVASFGRAVALAEETIYCIGEAQVGGSVNLNGKDITITGDVLTLTSNVSFRGNIKFEDIEIKGNATITSTGDITIGKNVVFVNDADITADNIFINSAIEGTVTADNVAIENDVSSDGLTIVADCIVYSGKGGKVVLGADGLYPAPEGGRAYRIDSGEYTVNTQKISNGTHYINYAYDFNLHSMKVTENNDGYLITISASAYNLLSNVTKNNPILCVAVYNNGRLSEFKSEAVGNVGPVFKEIQIADPGSAELDVRVYMLDSFARIRPLTNVLIEDNSEENVFYASPDGSASATGAFSDTLTIEAAVNRAKVTAGNSKIILRGGEYKLDETLNLSNSSNIEIAAYNNETPVITTADSISYSLFEELTDSSVKARIIDNEAKDEILVLDMEDAGISNYGTINRYELQYGASTGPILSADSEKLTLARYPNKQNGSDTFLAIASGTAGKPFNEGSTENNFSFFINEAGADAHLSQWVGNDDLYLFGYMSSNWADCVFNGSVESYGGSYRFVSAYPWRYAAPAVGGKVFFANLLEEIDSPGEWYLDRDEGKLYLYPTEDLGVDSDIKFTVSNYAAITANYAANIKISGVKFDSCGGAGITATSSNNIEISDCEFTNTLGTAISVNGTNCIVRDNYIHNVNTSGISVSGGNAEYLQKGANLVENNLVTEYANERKCYYPGISVGGVGNTARGNTIKNAPHQALGLGGQLNVIEYNYITDVCLETADSGALYAGGTFACPGNEIRYNYFENIRNRIGIGYSNNCVYLDDMFSSAEVYGNIFYNCQKAALFGGGRENSFTNNTIINCESSLTVDARGTWGTTWTQAVQTRLNDLTTNYSFYRNNTWKEAFPKLYNIENDHPELPMYNTVINNVLYNSPENSISEDAIENGEVEASYTVTSTAAFLDFENKIFSPHSNSEIYVNLPGFIGTNFDKIGFKNK